MITSQHNSEEAGIFKQHFGMKIWELRHLEVSKFIELKGIRRVGDLGCSEGKLIQRLSRSAEIDVLVGMDISDDALREAQSNCSREDIQGNIQYDRERPQQIKIYKGDITCSHPVLREQAFQLVTLIEVIEHLDPGDLPFLISNVFLFIRPPHVMISTPNQEFNIFFKLAQGSFRHWDHRFEWTRRQFEAFCRATCEQYHYTFQMSGVGEHVHDPSKGHCSQVAFFTRIEIPTDKLGSHEHRAPTEPPKLISATTNNSWRENQHNLLTRAICEGLYGNNYRVSWEEGKELLRLQLIGKKMEKHGTPIDTAYLRRLIDQRTEFEGDQEGYQLKEYFQSASEEQFAEDEIESKENGKMIINSDGFVIHRMISSIEEVAHNIPLLTIHAGPRDEKWKDRLKEELKSIIVYVKANKQSDNDWFKVECSKDGTKWHGVCSYSHNFVRYQFKLQFDIPPNYPSSPVEIELPQLEGKTIKMYRGGKICQDIHFAPLWAKHSPRLGISHAFAMALGPWLAAEVPNMVKEGKLAPK